MNSLLSVIGSPPYSMNCGIRVRHSSRKHEWTTEDERDNSLYVSMAERVPEQSQMPLGRECCFSACCKAMWSDERTRLRGHGAIKDVFLRGSLQAKSKTHYQKKNPRLVGVCEMPRQAGWWRFLAAGGRSSCPGRGWRWWAEQHFTWVLREVCKQAKAQAGHELVY